MEDESDLGRMPNTKGEAWKGTRGHGVEAVAVCGKVGSGPRFCGAAFVCNEHEIACLVDRSAGVGGRKKKTKKLALDLPT